MSSCKNYFMVMCDGQSKSKAEKKDSKENLSKNFVSYYSYLWNAYKTISR